MSGDLGVITTTKKLMSYILEVTEKSPTKYRHTYINKMINTCMEIIEYLYLANDTALGDSKRLEYQKMAKTKIKLLDYISEVSSSCNAILFKQYEHISKLLYECNNLLIGWINSDDNRLKNKGVILKKHGWGVSIFPVRLTTTIVTTLTTLTTMAASTTTTSTTTILASAQII